MLSGLLAAVTVAADEQPEFALEAPGHANPALTEQSPPGYLARIELNMPEEIEAALLRVERFYFANHGVEPGPPVVFVLHGPEVAVFQKQNYRQYKSIVDLAARLSAFDVVDVRVCETRLESVDGSPSDLYPFVGTVSFGPDEITRLIEEEGRSYF